MIPLAVQIGLRDIAILSLPRVRLKDRPGVIGVLLQNDMVAMTSQVHWGVSDKEPFQTWHNMKDLEPVPEEA